MPMHLQQIHKKDLIINEQDTRDVLIFFAPFRKNQINEMTITNNHRALAQGLLIEAADASKKMAVIQALTETVYLRNPMQPLNLIKTITTAAKAIYEYNQPIEVTTQNLKGEGFSVAAIRNLRKNFKTEVDLILQGEGSIYVIGAVKSTNNQAHPTQNAMHDQKQSQNASGPTDYLAVALAALKKEEADKLANGAHLAVAAAQPEFKNTPPVQTAQTAQMAEEPMSTMDQIKMAIAQTNAERAAQPSVENQRSQGQGRSV